MSDLDDYRKLLKELRVKGMSDAKMFSWWIEAYWEGDRDSIFHYSPEQLMERAFLAGLHYGKMKERSRAKKET